MYLYCANNPINLIDPMGQSIAIISVGIIVVAVVGIAIIPLETWQTMGEMVGAIASGIVDINKDVVKYIKDSSSKNVKVKNNDTSNSKSKKQSKSLPNVSEPNTSLDLKGRDGSLKLRRHYGPDGRAIKDIDYKHPDDGTHKFPHEHDWNWDNGTPQRSKYSK